jgi:hypothetical protein
MIIDGLSRTEGSTEADISDQTLVVTGIDEGPWRLARSDTILSIEERSLGSSTHQRPRSSQAEVEHADKSEQDPSLAENSLEPPSLPAHERKYYVDRWYIGLAIFNFGQTMLLSGIFLSTKETFGPIMYPENILLFFTNQVDWILCMHLSRLLRLRFQTSAFTQCNDVLEKGQHGGLAAQMQTGFNFYWKLSHYVVLGPLAS